MTETKRLEVDEVEASKAPLLSHLVELRSRLIKSVLAVVAGCIICIPFLRQIIQLLMWPFEQAIVRYNVDLVGKGLEPVDMGLIATHPLETFFVKASLFKFIVLLPPDYTKTSVMHFSPTLFYRQFFLFWVLL